MWRVFRVLIVSVMIGSTFGERVNLGIAHDLTCLERVMAETYRRCRDGRWSIATNPSHAGTVGIVNTLTISVRREYRDRPKPMRSIIL